MVNLANPRTVHSLCPEIFAHVFALTAFVSTVHERESGRGAPGSLAVGPLENHSAGSEAIKVWGFANLVSVAAERAGLEIVRNDEENILDLSRGEGCQRAEQAE